MKAVYRAGAVDPAMLLVLLVCGHWTQTVTPPPAPRPWPCPAGCGDQLAATDADDQTTAVLDSWTYWGDHHGE